MVDAILKEDEELVDLVINYSSCLSFLSSNYRKNNHQLVNRMIPKD